MGFKQKPSAIRKDRYFTLDSRKISIESASADDNGAYMSKGAAKKYFVFNENMCRTVDLGNKCDWYVRAKEGKDYVKEFASKKETVKLTILYRVSKQNKLFSRTFITVQKYLKKEVEPFYLVIYKWSGGADQNFILPCHGNSSKPSSGSYFKTKPFVDDLLNDRKSTDPVYAKLSKESTCTISETITSPNFIENLIYAKVKKLIVCFLKNKH